MIIDAANWQRPDAQTTLDIAEKVRDMLTLIESEGFEAIERFAVKFDQQKPRFIQLKPFEDYPLEAELTTSIKVAAKRIEDFANFQKQSLKSTSFQDEYGNFGQVIKPVERVGAYIPGGRFPLISTALMTLIPAKVAGSTIRIACSPSANDAILAAASLAGATRFIQIGGVQAIAALAYGYQKIKPVDLIVGPGNAWVNEAKKQIQSQIKIDGLAGPSELLAICDSNQPVDWLAYDALAQAEHDPLACSLVISDDQNWLEQLSTHLQSNTEFSSLLTNKQIELLYASNKEELITFSERYAPEHLMLCHKMIDADELSNYGSLFIGANSAVALGDYITGPNHTLPTLGFTRQTGGLNINTFLRILTTQTVNDHGRKVLSKSAMPIAKAEGLINHYESLKIRSE
ncbi:MAG: histidinol dehydrogenase [Gammaproteobacteria bacterium]|nr:histidinol dehydrogenase [Gammaproteobacteria bacterium]